MDVYVLEKFGVNLLVSKAGSAQVTIKCLTFFRFKYDSSLSLSLSLPYVYINHVIHVKQVKLSLWIPRHILWFLKIDMDCMPLTS